MTDFRSIHIALFDELERQGVLHVDVGRLTAAVLSTGAACTSQPPLRIEPPDPRCASGACEG